MVETVMSAVREPTGFMDRQPETQALAALIGGASLGIAGYGAAIHGAEGVPPMLAGAARALVTAGVAWSLSVPSLLVLGALLGSQVPWRRAVQASLVAVNFGGLAFLASIPVVMLIDLASPVRWTHAVLNLIVVCAVGGSSTLVFERAMAHLEGRRGLHRLFMGLFGVLFVELAFLVDLFRFTR